MINCFIYIFHSSAPYPAIFIHSEKVEHYRRFSDHGCKNLVNKNYVERSRSKEDRRVVYVRLTEKGNNAYHHHEDYHRQMTHAIIDKLDKEELPVLMKTLDALTEFFTGYSKESRKSE